MTPDQLFIFDKLKEKYIEANIIECFYKNGDLTKIVVNRKEIGSENKLFPAGRSYYTRNSYCRDIFSRNKNAYYVWLRK